MSAPDNVAVYRRLIEMVGTTGRLDELGEVFHEDAVLHTFPDKTVESLRKVNPALHEAFPDLSATVEAIVADGDRVAASLVWAGTNTGSFFGQPPTGKSFTAREIEIARFEDGKIKELWHVFDRVGMREQVGLV